MKAPQYTQQMEISRQGMNLLRQLVENELKWMLRPTHLEDDFGIDAYIDVVSEDRLLTGKTIAIQVKTGKSYFDSRNGRGWVFCDDVKHLNFYQNHDIPILIVLVDLEQHKAFWEVFDILQIGVKDNKWYLIIPFNQELSPKSKDLLLNYVSPVVDYADQYEEYWVMNSLLESADPTLIIDKEEISSMNYDYLADFVGRMSVNREVMYSLKEKVLLGIGGYDGDARELYEIPEVRTWLRELMFNVPGLAFFLRNELNTSFLLIWFYAMAFDSIKSITVYEKNGRMMKHVDIATEDMMPALELYCDNLKIFCQSHKIPIDVYKEILGHIYKFLIGDK